jgi:hypothetical protein
MQLLTTSNEFICVPMTGPYADLTTFPNPGMAIVPAEAAQPSTGQYQTAAWLNGEVAYKPTAGQFPAGDYMVYVRLVASGEDVRLKSGRIRFE